MPGNGHPLRGDEKETDCGWGMGGLALFWGQVVRVRARRETTKRLLSVDTGQWPGRWEMYESQSCTRRPNCPMQTICLAFGYLWLGGRATFTSLAVGSWLCTEGCLHIADPLASRKFPGHPQSLAVSQLNYSFGESQLLNILTEREWEVLMKWMHCKEATGQFQSHPPFTVYICPRVFDPCDLNSYITLNGWTEKPDGKRTK